MLGIPLQNWRQSEEICVRGDNIVISRQTIYCFEIAKITNITRELYAIYSEAYQSYGIPNLRGLETLTEKIDKFATVDFYVLLKCLLLTPDEIPAEELDHFVRIVRHLLDSVYWNHKMFMILNKLTSILYSAKKHFVITSANLMLTLWFPFRSNVSGFALYQNPNTTGFAIKSIFRNESVTDIDRNNLRIAGFVPNELLERITKNISRKKKSRLYVQMAIVIDSEKLANFFRPRHNSKDIIGISIPRFCKTNDLPLLEVFFDSTSDWRSFGRSFADSSEYERSEMCLLDQMTYFGSQSPNESASQQKWIQQQNCEQTDITTNTTSITFRQRKHDFIMHPINLCLNEMLQIPVLVCHEGLVFDIGDFQNECFKHPLSKHTEGLYEVLLQCYAGEKCKTIPTFLNHTDLTYLDVKLYFLILKHVRMMHYHPLASIDSLSDLLERGLKLLQLPPYPIQQINYVADFMDSFLNCLPGNFDNRPITKTNFIYRSIDPTSKIIANYGIVLRNNSSNGYEIQFLTTTNLTADYACDKSVKVVVVLLEDPRIFSSPEENTIFNIFVADNKEGGRMVGIRHVSYIHYEKAFKFAVFLRSNVGGTEDGQGEWTVVHSESEVMSIAYSIQSELRSIGKKVRSFKHVQ